MKAQIPLGKIDVNQYFAVAKKGRELAWDKVLQEEGHDPTSVKMDQIPEEKRLQMLERVSILKAEYIRREIEELKPK